MQDLAFRDLIPILISVVALVVGFVSLLRTSRLQEQQMRLQTKQEELTDLQLKRAAEEATKQDRADVRVELVKRGPRDYRFQIANWGSVPAFDVRFELEAERSPLVRGDYDRKIPIRELAPGGQCDLVAAITLGMPLVFNGRWSWRNPDGSEGSGSGSLSY